MAKIIICSKCGRERKHQGKGMCAPCYVREYKKKNNYMGPIKKCIDCGEEKPIKAKSRCKSCYDSWYRIQNIDTIKERKTKYSIENAEKIKEQQKKYRENNKEKSKERWKKYYNDNKEKLSEKYKKKYKENQKREIEEKLNEDNDFTIELEAKINNLLDTMPDMKRALVKEFINGPYSDRDSKTKIKLLLDLNRLLNFLKKNFNNKYYGGWGLVESVDIELCQSETGMLKDSLRIFFKWLSARKRNPVDLADAVPTETSSLRVNKVPITTIKMLYNKFNSEECNLELKIVGLLIIYYGLTVDELRSLKNEDISNGSIKLDDENIEIENSLYSSIEEYKRKKTEKFYGLTTGYFFETIYSIKKNNIISLGHFAKLFKKKDIVVTPSELRKAMIYFHKNSDQADPFFISELFRISPRGAARYF